jgi:hypothetical protein
VNPTSSTQGSGGDQTIQERNEIADPGGGALTRKNEAPPLAVGGMCNSPSYSPDNQERRPKLELQGVHSYEPPRRPVRNTEEDRRGCGKNSMVQENVESAEVVNVVHGAEASSGTVRQGIEGPDGHEVDKSTSGIGDDDSDGDEVSRHCTNNKESNCRIGWQDCNFKDSRDEEHQGRKETTMAEFSNPTSAIPGVCESTEGNLVIGAHSERQLSRAHARDQDEDTTRRLDVLDKDNCTQSNRCAMCDCGRSVRSIAALQRRQSPNVSEAATARRAKSAASCHIVGRYDALELLMRKVNKVYGRDEKVNGETKLDEIPQGLVGCFQHEKIKCPLTKDGILEKVLDLLRSEDVRDYLKGPLDGTITSGTPIKSSPDQWRFGSELLSSGLCKKVNRRKGGRKGYGRFFTVLKKHLEDGTAVVRTILDCKDANTLFKDPPPVNLPSLKETIKAFDGKERIVGLDFRHYFHQIPISEGLKRLFNIVFGSLTLEWQAVPMGWTWSCAVAQTLTWYLVCGEEVGTWKDLPPLLIRDGVTISVVYDNVMLGGDPEDVERLLTKLLQRLQLHNVRIKELNDSKINGFIDNLGLRWFPSSTGLNWEILEKFFDKAARLGSTISEGRTISVKTVAGLLGTVAWYRFATFQDLFDLCAHYQFLGSCVGQVGWGGSVTVGPEIMDILTDLKRCAPVRCSLRKTDVFACLASDASTTGYGGVNLGTGEFVRGSWQKKFISDDIFFLEALAAQLTVRILARDAEEVLLMIDNKSLVYAINKGSTSCMRTAQVLKTFTRNKVVSAIWIPTSMNPADEPSRGRDIEKFKINEALKVVEGGLIWGGWSGLSRHNGGGGTCRF